jgi:hypothetical protein
MSGPLLPQIDAAVQRETACFTELIGGAANAAALQKFNQ